MLTQSMVQAVWHENCPNKPKDEAPECKWGGFSMGDCSDYICGACGVSLMVEDEPTEMDQMRLRAQYDPVLKEMLDQILTYYRLNK